MIAIPFGAILLAKQCFEHEASLERSLETARLIRTLIVMASVAIAVTSSDAKQGIRAQKARVRFLATSTVFRGTWGTNQDVFLAEIRPVHNGELQLVRLIDEYPNFSAPLPGDVLKAQSGTILRVKRDAQCDRPFGEILLRTAPGDPMALLPERLGYQPQMDRIPEPRTLVPCYRIVR